MSNEINHIQFYTATILEWKHLLKLDKYKDIIVNSLAFLVKEQRVLVYGFVIMPNHIHIIWRIKRDHTLSKVQQSFLKFTAQQIKFDLIENHPKVLEKFAVNASDRQYQIWERKSLSIDIFSEKVLKQKLNYVHQNPVKAGLCQFPEEYTYSSASFYLTGETKFDFLQHFAE